MAKRQINTPSAPAAPAAQNDQLGTQLLRELVSEVMNTYAQPAGTKMDIPSSWPEQVKLCLEMRNGDAAPIIDLMVNAANSGVEVMVGEDLDLLLEEYAKTTQGKDRRGAPKQSKKQGDKIKKMKAVCDYWAANVNSNIIAVEPGLDRLNELFYEEMWGGSGVFIAQYMMEKVKIPGLDGAYSLPMKVCVHNPLAVTIEHRGTFADRVLTIGDRTKNPAITEIRSDRDGIMAYQVMSGNPDDRQEIKNSAYVGFLPGKKDYMVLPTPYLMRVAAPYKQKRGLYESDHSVMKRLLAALLIFREGVEGKSIDPAQLTALASRIQTMLDSVVDDTEHSKALVTGANTQAEWIQPKIESLLSHSKYFQAHIDFFNGLGILVSPSVSSGASEMKVQSMTPLITIIEGGRQKCKRMNEWFMRVIQQANKEFEEFPTPNIHQLRKKTLDDNDAIKMQVQNLFDRGAPWSFILSEFGYDQAECLRNAIWERQNGIEEILVPRATFRQQSDGRPKKSESPSDGEPDTKIDKE